jgi:hypothetical protein
MMEGRWKRKMTRRELDWMLRNILGRDPRCTLLTPFRVILQTSQEWDMYGLSYLIGDNAARRSLQTQDEQSFLAPEHIGNMTFFLDILNYYLLRRPLCLIISLGKPNSRAVRDL